MVNPQKRLGQRGAEEATASWVLFSGSFKGRRFRGSGFRGLV